MYKKVIEFCPHCETEAGIMWDIETEGHGLYCPYCGKFIMLCSECPVSSGELNCDWSEEGETKGKCCCWDNRSEKADEKK